MMKKIMCLWLVLVIVMGCGGCEEEGGRKGADKEAPTSNITSELAPHADQVSLVVNDCLTDAEIHYEVTPIKIQQNDAEGWKFYGYAISSPELQESVNGYFEIRIPYDESYIDRNADIQDCLCAKGFNEATEQWEYELFEIDEISKEVVILSPHLSNHGIVMFQNAQSAKQLGLNISRAFGELQSFDEAIQTMKNFIDDSLAWDEDAYYADISAIRVASDTFHAILCPIPEKINNHIYDSSSFVGAASSLMTLGNGFENSFFKKTLNKMSKLGLYTSVCKLCNELHKHDKTDEEILNLYNTLISTTVDLYGYAAEGLGPSVALSMAGVYVVSQVINEMFEEGMAIKMENMAAIYEYFGDQYQSGQYTYRTNKAWYDIFMDIFDRYTAAGKADYIEDAIDREIRLYAGKFWELDGDTVHEVIHDAGYTRMPYPTENEITQMIEDYTHNLYVRLEPIVAQCQKTMLLRQKQKAMEMLQTCYNYCNSPLTLELYDQSEDKSLQNCLYRFKDLGTHAEEVFAAGKLVDGKAVITFTFGQYLNAGAPTQIELFENEKALASNQPCAIGTMIPCQKAKEPSYVYFTKDTNEWVYCLDTTVFRSHWDNRNEDTLEDKSVGDIVITDNQIRIHSEDAYGNISEGSFGYPGKILKNKEAFNQFTADGLLPIEVYTRGKEECSVVYYNNGAFLQENIASCIDSMNPGDVVCMQFSDIALRYVCMSAKEAESQTVQHIEEHGLEYAWDEKWK